MWNENEALLDLSKSAFQKIADNPKLMSLDNIDIDFADEPPAKNTYSNASITDASPSPQ